jgi:hypothetical protein
MRANAIAVCLVLAATAACSNPVAYFDNIVLDLGGSNCSSTGPYSPIEVVVLLDFPSEESENGIASISFRFGGSFYGALLESEDLLGGPGDGHVDGDGWVSIAPDGCAQFNEWGMMPLARFRFFVLETGTIEVRPHLVEGPVLMPCGATEPVEWNHDNMYYYSYAGVGVDPPFGCYGFVPVSSASWGAIKALYR